MITDGNGFGAIPDDTRAICGVVLLGVVLCIEHDKERENKLNEQIDAQNDVLAKFSEKYDVVIEKLDRIERNQK